MLDDFTDISVVNTLVSDTHVGLLIALLVLLVVLPDSLQLLLPLLELEDEEVFDVGVVEPSPPQMELTVADHPPLRVLVQLHNRDEELMYTVPILTPHHLLIQSHVPILLLLFITSRFPVFKIKSYLYH